MDTNTEHQKPKDRSAEYIVLRINTPDKYEFIEAYRDAVLDTLMLLFERRELDLSEPQMYSLYLLAQSARSVAVYQPRGQACEEKRTA